MAAKRRNTLQNNHKAMSMMTAFDMATHREDQFARRKHSAIDYS